MFKNFFIGLIILSALSSEGSVVLQRDYYNLFLCNQSELSILSSNDIELVLSTETDNKDTLLFFDKVLSNSSLKLTKDRERFEFNDSFRNFEKISYKADLPHDHNQANCNCENIFSREPVIEGTDSSPPFYKI